MLKTLVGPRPAELFAQARLVLGDRAEMVQARPIVLEDGLEYHALTATDGENPPSDQELLQRWGLRSEHCAFRPTGRDLVRLARAGEPMVIALVGPPGAGKTTSMAKLALHHRAFGEEGLRVVMACLDTYRAGAAEQLRLYAEMANAEFELVYDAADVARLRASATPPDLLLVDAPGRGWRQEGDLKAVQHLLRELRPHETHLVLPAGLRPTVATEWVERYRQLRITHLLPTKLDDCPDDWAAFDLAARLKLPMRWMGEGQDVPMDLRSATPRLARAILAHATRHYYASA